MIEASSAVSIGNDTAEIMLERVLVGLDGNGDGILSDGRHELSLGLLNHVVYLGDFDLTVVLHETLVGNGMIGILGLGDHVVESSVVHAVGLPATIAALVHLDAVNTLLLRQLDRLLGSNGMSALHGTDSRKSPAGAASTLVLNRLNNTLGLSPINRSRKISDVEDLNLALLDGVLTCLVLLVNAKEARELLTLLSRHVRELVMSDSVSLSLVSIPRLDLLVDLSKQSLSHLKLFLSSVALAKELGPGVERSIELKLLLGQRRAGPLPRLK